MVQDGPQTRWTRRPRRRLSLLGAAALAVFVTAAGIAAGAVGDLTYVNCITGEAATGPGGTNACAAIPSASPAGSQSGYNNPQSTAISPDGRSLYLASGNDASVARFDRDPASGALTYQGCIGASTETGPTVTNACALVANDQSFGFDSGFDNMRAVTVSADGTSVYAVSGGDDAVVGFSRSTSTGALTYQGCITGETQSGPSGTNACAAIAGAATDGSDSGLDFLTGVVVSPDGTSVYVTSLNDNAVARFTRDPGTGALTYQGCITGETESGPSGSNACAAIPAADTFALDSGLNAPTSPVMTGSASLYVAAGDDDAVARFNRNTGTGALTYQDCITGETQSGPSGSNACAAIPAASTFGGESGLDGAFALSSSADGTSVYAAGRFDDAIAAFSRNTGTGAVTYQSCITGETETGPVGTNACAAIPSATSGGNNSGLGNPFALAVSPGGGSVYAVTEDDDGVTHFARDAATGALTYRGCVTGETQSGPAPGGNGACAVIPSHTPSGDQSGLDKPRSLVVSPDNTSLYATSPADDSVARFNREAETPTPPPPGPEPYRESCFGITVDGKTQVGGNGNDKLDGTAQSDQLRGAGGNDRVRGDDAADCLFGNAGKDKVSGQDGDDVVRGGAGNDRITGGKGDDTIRAQDGDDKVKAGADDDFIKAQGRGSDNVNCGGGKDRVVGDVKDTISKNCENVKIVDPR